MLRVTVSGLDDAARSCLTLVFLKDGREVKRVPVRAQETSEQLDANRVRLEGSSDGACPWARYALREPGTERPLVGGRAEFVFVPVASDPTATNTLQPTVIPTSTFTPPPTVIPTNTFTPAPGS